MFLTHIRAFLTSAKCRVTQKPGSAVTSRYLNTRFSHYDFFYIRLLFYRWLNFQESFVACSGKVPSTYRFPGADLALLTCFSRNWGFLSIVVDVLAIPQSSVHGEITKLYPLIFSQRCNEDRYALYNIQQASCSARASRTNYPKSILVENPLTDEPRFNEVPRDRGNLFFKSRVRYIKHLHFTNFRENYQNVCYIEV